MHKRLGDVLIDLKLATPQQILNAVDIQSKTGLPLGEILVQMKIASDEQIAEALAEQQDVPTWNLKKQQPTIEALKMLSGSFCRFHQVLPVSLSDQVLTLAMQHAGNLAVVDEARKLTKCWVQAVHAPDKVLASTIDTCYGLAEEEAVDSLVTQALDEFAVSNVEAAHPVSSEEETRPVISLVNQIIADAVRLKASDVHIEPREKTMELRYRVDGRLIKTREIPLALMPMLTARIKIMADLDVADHRLPQDGRISARHRNRHLDLRVSIFPCKYGSRTVFRVLDRNGALKPLEELGFSPANLRNFRNLIDKPYGIVLVTGPTGSGKTTTLYSALNEIREESTNIITVEDPIEYEIPGISQSQVHDRIGLTFAAQLRSILRQDPDVILVGEIRDRETAEIAIRAALTGHLVLSTLHCNDSPSAIPRLFDMGVQPYLVSTSLIGVVAQRLLRVLCPKCKKLEKPTDREIASMETFGKRLDKVVHPIGCDACNRTGYSGRLAIHEILTVSEDMERIIAAGGSVEVLREKGAQLGYRPMKQEAWDRIEQGLTTFEEAARLIFFNSATDHNIPEDEIKLKKAG